MRRLPAEWESQSGILLTWPHAYGDWQTKLSAAEAVFLEIAFHISQYQHLIISCWDTPHLNHVTELLKASNARMACIHLFIVQSNDSWVRDHGPITVLHNSSPLLLDFTFNAWGEKYAAELDNKITKTLFDKGAFQKADLDAIDFVLEGGSIDVDGEGTLLTTSRCLLSSKRNPHKSRDQIEAQLKDCLGLTRVLWLEHGYIEGDDTDNHIDMLARFCSNMTIAYTSCNNESEAHYEELKLMKQELESLKSITGNPYQLIPLPPPVLQKNDEGQSLPASYANFLITNKAVLVPNYNGPNDELANLTLQQLFPGRKIIGINCLPLIHQYGSLHCVTMQLPIRVL